MNTYRKSDPIFVVGAPRSGTSLLRVLLNRHPAIGLCDETYFFYYVFQKRRFFGSLENNAARQHLIEKYLEVTRIKKLGLDHEKLAAALLQSGDSYESFFLTLLEFYASQLGKWRCGEKTPQHALFSEMLCRWYPECKVIHLVRDPRDVVASLLRMPWSSKSVTANARLWRAHVAGAERVRDTPNFLRVSYEDLVSDPANALQRICTFIGEEYSPQMLNPESDSHNATGGKEWWFQRAKEPLSRERMGKWQEELSLQQAGLVEWIAKPYLHYFGYAETGEAVGIDTRLAALGDEVAQMAQRKLRNSVMLWNSWLHPTRLATEEARIDANT